MKRSIKFWLGKIFARDVDLGKSAFLYLFFSFLSIMFIVEYYILKFFINMEVGLDKELPVIMAIFGVSIFFLAAGFFIDIIKKKTKFFNILLLICIIGLFLTNFNDPLYIIIGILIGGSKSIPFILLSILISFFGTVVIKTALDEDVSGK